MTVTFKDATRHQLKIKLGLMGTAGTGKTWNGLAIAEALAGKDGTIGVIDSERGRAEAYAGDFTFKHHALQSTSPEAYIDALAAANDEGFDVIMVDGISHEWIGKDGILPSVDRFGGWKEATPRHDAFVETLFRLPRHVICTIRAKTQYLVEEVEEEGRRKPKQKITKLGVGPVQRDNLEYEFDLLMMMELDHSATLHKSVIATLPSGSVLSPGENPRALGREIAFAVREWVNLGQPVAVPEEADEAEVAYLRALLETEGFDESLIENQFKKRRLELGALTPEYVEEQILQAENRLTSKSVDIDPIRLEWGRQTPPSSREGDDVTHDTPEASPEPDGLSEPHRESGEIEAAAALSGQGDAAVEETK